MTVVQIELRAAGAKAEAGVHAEERDNNFDAMRFAMAMLVVWSHCFPFTLGDGDTHEPLYRWTGGRTTFGGIAVDVFFVISGFLVTMSWERSGSALSYLKKRVSRIYPGYVVATLVCAFVVAPLFVAAGMPWMNREYAVRLMKALPQLQEYQVEGVFSKNPYPGSMYGIVWTIKYEFLCYLLVMGLGLTGMLRRGVVLGLFVVTLAVYATGVKIGYPHFVERVLGDAEPWPQLLTFYLSGMVFYLYRHRIPQRDGLAAAALGLLAIGLFALPALPVALAIGGAYLVFWLAFQKYVTAPGFAKYGDFSYGIYLYGFPIQQMIVAMYGVESPELLFLVSTPPTIVAAAASWHLVEKWFLRKKAQGRAAVVQTAGKTVGFIDSNPGGAIIVSEPPLTTDTSRGNGHL